MEFSPKISIIIPVYNGSNYLAEAIDSALAQTYNNIEVIVVNDGSNDEGKTESLAMSYGERIRYYHKENGGVATALNLGIEKADGDYISWLSHDDIYVPEKLERQIKYLRCHSDPKLILYGEYKVLEVRTDANNFYKVVGDAKRWLKVLLSFGQNTTAIEQTPLEGGFYNTVFLLFCGRIHGCALLLPRSCFEEVGMFNEKLKTTQDYELWFKLLKKGYKFIPLAEVLVINRLHGEQGMHTMSDIHSREAESLFIWVYDLFCEEFNTFSRGQMEKAVAVLRSRNLQKLSDHILCNWLENHSGKHQ